MAQSRSNTSRKAKAGGSAKRRQSSGSRSRVRDMAGRAKVPLVAGSAVLAGAAGGMAIEAWRARRRPHIKLDSRDLAKAAKGAGAFGAQLGQLASELHQARESANGGAHRSPIEVVLEGLTARRARA